MSAEVPSYPPDLPEPAAATRLHIVPGSAPAEGQPRSKTLFDFFTIACERQEVAADSTNPADRLRLAASAYAVVAAITLKAKEKRPDAVMAARVRVENGLRDFYNGANGGPAEAKGYASTDQIKADRYHKFLALNLATADRFKGRFMELQYLEQLMAELDSNGCELAARSALELKAVYGKGFNDILHRSTLQ